MIKILVATMACGTLLTLGACDSGGKNTATPTNPQSSAVPSDRDSSSLTASKTLTGAPASTVVPSSQPAQATGLTRLCPGVAANNAQALVTCIHASVADFWSGELNQVVTEPVVLAPQSKDVAADCRPGLALGTAFYCRDDDTVYITAALAGTGNEHFGADSGYALASIISHEIGHAVQRAVHQPGFDSEDESPTIEQQADCLSGVWGGIQAKAGKLDAATFLRISVQQITDISSNAEIAGHGTPAQRSAAISRGLAEARPQACRLATFS